MWRALTQPARYAALVAGALPVLAFPAPNLEFLAWFALVPGLLLMRVSPSAREAGVRGWWFGAGFIFAAHYWLLPNIGPTLQLIPAFWLTGTLSLDYFEAFAAISFAARTSSFTPIFTKPSRAATVPRRSRIRRTRSMRKPRCAGPRRTRAISLL